MPPGSDQLADVFLQISFLYEALNLVLQLEAFKCVMRYVLMEFAILCHVPSFCGSSHRAWIAEQVFHFHLHEDLFSRCVKWGVDVETAHEGLRGRAW